MARMSTVPSFAKKPSCLGPVILLWTMGTEF